MVDKHSSRIICTAFSRGGQHDFKLFKHSQIQLPERIKAVVDSGYLGIKALHANSELLKKKSKLHSLTKQDKRANRELASLRVLNEHVIGRIKRFKIISCKYRNRRRRFGLRFNLICAIHNLNLEGF